MTIELSYLAWAIVLGLVHVVVAAQFSTAQNGIAYNMGPRDEKKPLTGVAGRLDRAFANYMQTFPFFAAAVLIAHLANRHSWLTVTGVTLYFWARLVFVPLYAFGIPVVRTLAFLVATAGIVLLLIALT